MESKPGLDAKDWRILEILQKDGRITWADLGRQVGLSAPAVTERVRALEDSGVIQGWGARVDPHALGLELMALIRLRTTHAQMRSCLEAFDRMDHVLETHRVTGEDCFVLKVLVGKAAQLQQVVDDLARYGAVVTSVVLSSSPPKPVVRSLSSPA
jgi:Lrp/AsnC family leucine-responsive transcriptional regulator